MPREWYFVRKLRPHERLDLSEQFEIQVLDDVGRAAAVGYIGEESTELVISGKSIPRAVLEAAKRRQEGSGEYVGPDGNCLPPF